MDAIFPVGTKQASAYIKDIPTSVVSLGYSNYFVLLISQCNNFGSLIKLTANPELQKQTSRYQFDAELSDEEDIMLAKIVPHSTTFLLGNPSSSQRGLMYELVASRVCQAIYGAKPDESRPILIGISLKPELVPKETELTEIQIKTSKLIIDSLLELVESCKLW
ncbi:hypothetical protein BB561_004926 [Smittium simulii]|uniref:Proteasome assembly chaperone 3 n=1 Tax=Smittium simulii TaxID=133385 RepID=A0A2T9YDB5_9FUNG|nr:hypothetical protein BB561_004926 [Smittium simulii]